MATTVNRPNSDCGKKLKTQDEFLGRKLTSVPVWAPSASTATIRGGWSDLHLPFSVEPREMVNGDLTTSPHPL